MQMSATVTYDPLGAGRDLPKKSPGTVQPGNCCSSWHTAHVRRIMQLVKVFHGDVYGEALLACPFWSGGTSAEVLRCRLGPEAILQFIAVLRIDYDICRLDNGSYLIRCPMENLPSPASGSSSEASSVRIEMQVTAMPWREWCLTAADFDIDMLAMDSSRIYARPVAHTRLQARVPDAFVYLMQRLQSRRFCLTDAGRTLLQNRRALRRARSMLAAGWEMDDFVLGANSWILAQHRRLAAARSVPLASFDAPCPLCYEAFKPDDVVVHLSCGHCVHHACTADDAGSEDVDKLPRISRNHGSVKETCADNRPQECGLAAWIETPNGNTCPYCRAVI